MSSKYIEYDENTGCMIDMNEGVNCETETNTNVEYCDACKCLAFDPDSDPKDRFRDDDKKAVCTAINAIIVRGLEYNELTNICRPLFCPKRAKELANGEKKETEE